MGGRKKPEDKEARKQEDHGLLLGWFESANSLVHKISLGGLLEKGHPNHLDYYIISWFILEIALTLWLVFNSFNGVVAGVVIALLSYRLFEIGIGTFDSVVILPMIGKKHRSIPRLASLILANYLQIIVSFGILFFILLPQFSLPNAFFYSVSFATLAGASFDSNDAGPLVAAIAEMLIAVLFIAGAIGAIANYLGNKE